MKEKMALKKIELELYFSSEFVPPDKFCETSNKCGLCPFYNCDDETSDCWCALNLGTVDASVKCPIRKFFEKDEI